MTTIKGVPLYSTTVSNIGTSFFVSERRYMPSILFALSDEDKAMQIKDFLSLERPSFELIAQNVNHIRYLTEITSHYKPDILLIFEKQLYGVHSETSDYRNELMGELIHLRTENPKTRIIYVHYDELDAALRLRLGALQVYDYLSFDSFDFKTLIALLDNPTSLTDYLQSVEDRKQEHVPNKFTFSKRLFEKEGDDNYKGISSKLIVIGSYYRGAGSTILATNLARTYAEHGVDVAYIEHPSITPYMYDYLQIHTDEEQVYVDVRKDIRNERVMPKQPYGYEQFGVRWQVNDPQISIKDAFTFEQLYTMIRSVRSNIVILDISNLWTDSEVQKILRIADEVFVCVEPNLIKNDWKLHANEQKEVEKVLTDTVSAEDFEIVLMKDIEGIDFKLVRDQFVKSPFVKVPYMNYEKVQQAMYRTKLLYDFEDFQDVFEQSLSPILRKTLPRELLSDKKVKKSLLTRLFS